MTGMVGTDVRGELPGERQTALLEAALVASVDHGPQAPSIAIARMTAGSASIAVALPKVSKNSSMRPARQPI